MDRQTLLRYLPDPAPSNLAVYVTPGTNVETVRSEIVHAVAGHRLLLFSDGEIRAQAIHIFDRTFAITYALEAVAVLVAVMGIAGALLALVIDRRREQAHTLHLRELDFVLQPVGDTWKSPTSGASYAVHWKISVAKLGLELEARTPLPSQELAGDSHIAPIYWEGAIDLAGKRSGAAVTGSGYLEMTGYAKGAEAPI
jgi:hypothetical protein